NTVSKKSPNTQGGDQAAFGSISVRNRIGKTAGPKEGNKINGNGAPNEGEGDGLAHGERFSEDDHSDEELECGRQVLEKSHRREPQKLGGAVEPQQGQGGHDPGAEKQKGELCRAPKGRPSLVRKDQNQRQGRRSHERGLDQETNQRAHGDGFS